MQIIPMTFAFLAVIAYGVWASIDRITWAYSSYKDKDIREHYQARAKKAHKFLFSIVGINVIVYFLYYGFKLNNIFEIFFFISLFGIGLTYFIAKKNNFEYEEYFKEIHWFKSMMLSLITNIYVFCFIQFQLVALPIIELMEASKQLGN